MNSAILSKINWTQVVSLIASVLAVWGMDLAPETQVAIVAAIQAAQSLLTIILRTWFTEKKA